MKQVIEDSIPCVIEPSDIDVSRHFRDAFGSRDTETAARLIVQFCQEEGYWSPFKDSTMEKFYRRVVGQPGFSFCRLVADGWIVKGDDDLYRPTFDFVARCYGASPVLPVPVPA